MKLKPWILIAAVVIGLAIFLIVVQMKAQKLHLEAIAKAGLPNEFFEIQTRLEHLTLKTAVSKLHWLDGQLQALDLEAPNYTQVSDLPTSLRTLHLRKTGLTSLNGLGRLNNLKSLILMGNQRLTDLAVLKDLPALKELTLRGNGGVLQIPWSELTALEFLSIEGEASFDPSGFAQIPKLKTLLIQGQVPLPGDLTDLAHLNRVLLKNTPLKILPTLPSGLSHLELEGNRSLGGYALIPTGIQNLTVLHCGGFDPGLLPDGLSKLSRAHLHWEATTPLSVLQEKAPALTDLTLEEIPLTDLDDLPDLWAGLKGLGLVNLANLNSLEFLSNEKMTLNRLAIKESFKLEAEAFAPISSLFGLKELRLTNTRVETIDLTEMALTQLFLEQNEFLTSFPKFPQGHKLERLVLAFNPRLTNLSMETLPMVAQFDYTGPDQWLFSALTESIKMRFEQKTAAKLSLERLTHLWISSKGVQGLGFLKNAPNLRVLDLSQNPLPAVGDDLPKGLMEIHLGDIHGGWQHLPVTLRRLSVSCVQN